jgi:hypothetical protein
MKNPTYLYGLASIAIIDILVQDSIVHFVLEYPVIFNKNIVPLHKTDQIGMHISGNQCIYFQLPTYFFTMERKTYEISLANKCITHRDLTICTTYKHLLKTSCINETHMGCPYSAASCTSPFHFSYTTAGLLIRDNTRESYLTNIAGPIRKVSFNNNSIAMVPWSNIVNVFIGQELLIENPGDNFASMTTITDFNVTLDDKFVFPIDISNITASYQKFFANSGNTPLNMLETIQSNKAGLKSIIIASLIALAAVALIFTAYHVKKRITARLSHKKQPTPQTYRYRTLPEFEFAQRECNRTRHASF